MSLERLFTNRGTWQGAFYELSIELGPRSNDRLDKALKALWEYYALQGCWLDRDKDPCEETRITPAFSNGQQSAWYFGVADLPHDRRVACGTYQLIDKKGSDWLNIGFPMGALGNAYPAGEPPYDKRTLSQMFEPHKEPWRRDLDHWLVGLAKHVFVKLPYQLALIGRDIGAEIDSKELSKKGVPEERWFGILLPDESKLEWYPPTNYSET